MGSVPETQVQSIYNQIRNAGSSASIDDVRRALNNGLTILPEFLAKFNRPGGVEALENQIVGQLQELALNSSQAGRKNALAAFNRTCSLKAQPAVFHGQARLRNVNFAANACFYGGLTALYGGVISLACPVCAPVAGGIGLAATAIAFLAC